MRFVTAVLLLVASSSSFARCYLGADIVEVKLRNLTTKFEDQFSRMNHIQASVSKDLTTRAPQAQLGCFVTENVGVSLGYIRGVKFGTNTTITADYDAGDKTYSVQLPSIVRDVQADVSTAAVTYHTGADTSFIRGFMSFKVIHGRISYRVSAVYTDPHTGYDYAFSGLAKKQKTAAVPEFGLLVRSTENSQMRIGYGYYGPRAHQVSVGTMVYF